MQKLQQALRGIKAADYQTKGMAVCLALFVLLALALRDSMVHAKTFDYIYYLQPWTDYLAAHGLHAFHDNFANYNTPYLLLLWFGHHLHLSDLAVVKGISIFFDFVLAWSVSLVVGHFRPKGWTKYVAGVVTLFLPTVFMNSSLWGQCDAIYTSFVILALYAGLKNRDKLAWFWWGVAFSFKLQAVFFVPFLLFMTFNKRWRWWTPFVAVGVFVVLSALPVLEGRSVHDTLSIYINQTQPTGHLPMLSWFSATFYQWMPNEYFKQLKNSAVIIGGTAGLGVIMCAFRRRAYNKEELMTLATLSLFAIPFFLPNMHERYFMTAEIASLILAFVVPRLAWTAVVMQIVTVMSYRTYFTSDAQQPYIPLPILSLFVLTIICGLAWHSYRLASAKTSKLASKPTNTPTLAAKA